MNIFTRVRNAAEEFFTGPVWAFVEPFVKTIESQGGQIIIAAAENAVIAGATAGGGAAAMAAALTSFEKEVVANGVPFVESQARAAIELALQRAKAALPAVPVQPVTVADPVVASTAQTPLDAARANIQASVNTVAGS